MIWATLGSIVAVGEMGRVGAGGAPVGTTAVVGSVAADGEGVTVLVDWLTGNVAVAAAGIPWQARHKKIIQIP
jgi:hypothetical protein